MRDDLNGTAEIVAATLLPDHAFVDLTRCEVVVLAGCFVDETFVMAQVQVGLSPVVGDKDLPVLEGTHGSRINVDVGIQLHHGDLQSPCFQQCTQRSRSDAFPE